MTFQAYINSKNITKYQLSKISGVPKTTVIDICSGKSSLEKCSARTIQQLAKALDCSMEFIMSLDPAKAEYDSKTGLPYNDEYLERGLPPYLQISLEAMKESWETIDSGNKDLHWDLTWCDLNSDINVAEVEQEISSEQAWYLRKKYLRMERDDD